MKTWKTKRTVCRSRKSGKFAGKKKCGMFKKSQIRACCLDRLFK